MGYKKFLGPGSSELVTRNSWEKLSTFLPDFPVKDSWEFPRIFRKIVTWEAPLLSSTHDESNTGKRLPVLLWKRASV